MINDIFHTAYCSYIQVSKATARKTFQLFRPVQVGIYGRGPIGCPDFLIVKMADRKQGCDLDRIEREIQPCLDDGERLKYFVPVYPRLDERARTMEHGSRCMSYVYNDTMMSYNQYLEQRKKCRA